MAQLQLTKGKIALIDDADLPLVNRWKWGYVPRSNGVGGYVARWESGGSSRTTIYLHRQLMNAQPCQQVDHINGDGLDNRRSNLRLCSQSQNFANRRILPQRSLPYRGVYYDKRRSNYFAAIKVNGKSYRLGTFTNPKDAALAYDKAAQSHFGDFASLNFPKEI